MFEETSIDVGKMVTRKQNGSTKMTKMKRIIQSVKSNGKGFPTSFSGSVFGISNELMVGFSVADDEGKGLKRRKVQDSSTLRKAIGSSLQRKEIGLNSQRQEIGLSSQRKESRFINEDFQQERMAKKSVSSMRKARTCKKLAKEVGVNKKRKKEISVVYSNGNRKVDPRVRNSMTKLNRLMSKMSRAKELKKEVQEGYRPLKPIKSALYNEIVDTDIVNLVDDDDDDDNAKVKKEDINAKDSVGFAMEEIDVNFDHHDIERFVFGKIEDLFKFSYDCLNAKKDAILRSGSVAGLPSSECWKSAKVYYDAIAKWVEVSEKTLKKLSPVIEEEKKFKVDVEEKVYVEEQLDTDEDQEEEEEYYDEEQQDIDGKSEDDDEQLREIKSEEDNYHEKHSIDEAHDDDDEEDDDGDDDDEIMSEGEDCYQKHSILGVEYKTPVP